MRFGGPVLETWSDPDDWAAKVRALGYGAAYCPAQPEDSDELVAAYAKAAAAGGFVIAEVGAWSNPISPDEATRKKALDKCKAHLALADRIGARCCVNIAGSRGQTWDGPGEANLTDETFDRIVTCVREIVDAVRPARTFYTLETMPWASPDSADSYVRLLRAVDRERFAVHFDPVNLIHSPPRYFATGEVIRDFLAKLAPHVRSCHAKDISMSNRLTTHLDEVRPGLGNLDYRVFLSELDKLDADVPLMLEHLPTAEEYAAAAAYVRRVAGEVGVTFR
jgi:sugar phosphate isomerase/epimerase